MRTEERTSPSLWPQQQRHADHRCAGRVARCRLKLDAARREITRLQLAVDHLRTQPPAAAAAPSAARLDEPPAGRRAYAPDPLGATPRLRQVTPPDPSLTVEAVNAFHVTNLGTLLDMLA